MSSPIRGVRRQSPRRLVRTGQGSILDEATGAAVSISELAADVGRGRRFVVIDEASGARCTYQVLADVLRSTVSEVPDLLGEMLTSLGKVGAMQTERKGMPDGDG